MNAPTELQELLCEQWCADIDIGEDNAGIRLSLPLTESDGDAVTVWINQRVGGWHLRDYGTTFMRLSYDTDVDLLTEGQRARVANTFYEDLKSHLIDIIGADRLRIDYEVPGVQDAKNYLVDFAITDIARPLYIFGVPSTDKAKLANIVLLHLQQANRIFDSLIIPSDIESIGKPDLRRLMNAANDFVDSSASTDVMERKIRQRLTAS